MPLAARDKSSMSGQELFERLLGSLHEAVLDDTLWPETSRLIDEAFASRGNFLVTGDGTAPDDIDIFFARFCFHGQRREDLERWYLNELHLVDERLPRIRQLPDSRVAHVDTLYTEEEKKTSLFYNEMLPSTHSRDSLNMRLDGPRGSRIVWGVADPVAGDGWAGAGVRTVRRFLPHLRQFVRLRQALVDAQALGSSATALLENTRCGVFHLDRRGRIVAANDRARNLLRKGDGLADREGLLEAASAEDDAVLQRLLARALPRFGGQGESGSMTVGRVGVLPRLVLHVHPVGGGRIDARSSRTAALALAIDPASRERIDPGTVSAMLGLTPAESRVAVLLAQGYSIADIAARTERGEGTIRWHTKQIFRKYNISGQTELVRMVLSLSDISEQRS